MRFGAYHFKKIICWNIGNDIKTIKKGTLEVMRIAAQDKPNLTFKKIVASTTSLTYELSGRCLGIPRLLYTVNYAITSFSLILQF